MGKIMVNEECYSSGMDNENVSNIAKAIVKEKVKDLFKIVELKPYTFNIGGQVSKDVFIPFNGIDLTKYAPICFRNIEIDTDFVIYAKRLHSRFDSTQCCLGIRNQSLSTKTMTAKVSVVFIKKEYYKLM